MPYKVDWHMPTVTMSLHGNATIEELSQASCEVKDNPNYQSVRHVIIDFSDIDGTPISDVLQIMQLASGDKAFATKFPDQKIAFVSTNRQVIEWIKIYEWELQEFSWQVQCFSTLKKAHSWLEISSQEA